MTTVGQLFLFLTACFQVWALARTFRLGSRIPRWGRVGLLMVSSLFLARSVLAFYQVFARQVSLDPIEEFIALVFSLLLVAGVVLLPVWIASNKEEGETLENVQSQAVLQLRQQSLWLAIFVLLTGVVLGYAAYVASGNAVTERLIQGSLNLARMLEATPPALSVHSDSLAEYDRLWRDAHGAQSDDYLCVIGRDGRLLLNTRHPENVGVYVGNTLIPTGKQEQSTVKDLVDRGGSWAGRNHNHRGEHQIAAYAYSTNLQALLAVHVPADRLDAEIRAAVLPWATGMAIICLVVLPLMFGLLYFAGATAQKAAFRAIHRQDQTEARYRAIVESEPECVKLLGKDGALLEMNPAGLRMIEADSIQQVIHQPTYPLIVEKHRAAFRKLNQRVFAGESGTLEFEIIGLKGGRRWLETHATPLHDKAGRVTALLGVTRDITERKQAAEAIQEYRTVFQRAGWGMAIADAETNQLNQVNPAFAKMHGYEVEELVGKSLADVFAPESRAELPRHAQAVHEKGHYVYETIHMRKDGSRFPCLADVTAFKDDQGRVLFRAATFEDITERKQAETRLRESEASLAVAQARAHLGSWEMDLATDQGKWSAEMFRLHYLDPAHGSPSFEQFLETVHPEDRLNIANMHDAIATMNFPTMVEYRSNPSLGPMRYLSATVHMAWDLKNHPVRLEGTTLDITERRNAEEERWNSEARYRALFDYAPDGILIIDSHRRPLDANKSLCRMFGYTHAEFIRLHASAIVAPVDRPQIESALDQITSATDHYRLWRLRRKDGSSFEAEVIATLMPNGNVLAMIRDISERKRVESEVRELQHRFEKVFRGNLAAMSINTVREGRLMEVNEGYCEFFGYGREELLGHTVPELKLWADPNDRVEFIRLLLAEGSVKNHELKFRQRSGKVRDVLLSVELISMSPGKEPVSVSMFIDITERKRAEAIQVAMLSLETRLSAASMPEEAAQVIFDTADQFWDWDAGSLDIYSAAEDRVWSVKYFDIVDGQRQEVVQAEVSDEPTPRMRRIMRDGPQLILRELPFEAMPDSLVFGDQDRLSASIMAVPSRVRSQVVGVLSIQSYTVNAFTEADLKLLQGLADHCGGALERIRTTEALRSSRGQLREFARRLQDIREEERTAIAREIHDVLAQELTRLKLDMSWLTRRMARPVDESTRPVLLEKVASMTELADVTIDSVQRIATNLRPVVLDRLGLGPAIEWQVEDFQIRTGIVCTVRVEDNLPTLEPAQATALFRIVQESLTNVARHANADRVEVTLVMKEKHFSLTVRDNGRGITPGQLKDLKSIGLLGMKERAALLGGETEIAPLPDGGTFVRVVIPLTTLHEKEVV